MKIVYLVGAPRISIASNSTTPGPRSHILGVLGALDRQGHSVDRYISSQSAVFRRLSQTEEADIRVSRAKLLVGDFTRLGVNLLNKILLRRHVGGKDFDIAYERFSTFQTLGRMFHRRGATWIVESNGIFYKEAFSDRKSIHLWRLARWHERRTYENADAVVVVSSQLKSLILSDFGLDERKCIVIPNGVDGGRFAPKQRPSSERDFVTVGFVGQLIEWQGIDRLLRVLTELPGVYVDIVGDGPARSALEALAKDLNLESRVNFYGRLSPDDVVEMMHGFDIGYAGHFASDGETYHSPLKLYEYAASGIPIVCTGSEVSRELSVFHPTFQFASESLDELKLAILSSMEVDSSFHARLERAREATSRCSWDARAKMIFDEVSAIESNRQE